MHAVTIDKAIRAATKAARGIVTRPMKPDVSRASDGVLQLRVSSRPRQRSAAVPEVISEALWLSLEAAPPDFERYCRSRWHFLVERHRLTIGA